MREASLYGSGPEEPAGSGSNEDRLLVVDCPTDCSAERDGDAIVGAIQHDAPKSRQPCAFCGARGQHWTSSCSKYVMVADRYDRVKELQLCSVCLHKDHWRTNAKPCRVPENRLCAFCGKARHHQALCPTFLNKRCAEGSSTQRRNNPVRQTDDDRRGRRQKSRTPKYGFEEARAQTNAQPATNQTVRQTDDDHTWVRTHDSNAPTEPDEDELEPFDPSSFYRGHAAVGVAHAPEVRTHGTFLECVMVTVFNPKTNKRERVCAFFDCGSSGTFVSTELADALGLPNLGSVSIRLGTFAQDKPLRLDTFRTTIGFETDGSCLVLDLKASPKLVPPLEAVFIEPSDEALLRRNRCNLVPQNVVPDILIGKDTERMFLKEYEHPPLPNGFTLLRTTIGTILSGYGQFNQRSADLIHTAQ